MHTKYVKLRNKIEKAILKQLEEGKNLKELAHYKDLVDDYMRCWDIKNKLFDDIEKRGVSIAWNNGGGQAGFKKNESISEMHKTHQHMLRILSDLGIRASDLPHTGKDEGL